MANIGGKYKRFMAIGCSHGHLADPEALETVLRFKRTFKPQRRFHLGDFTDMAAFRSGAQGTPDETVSIADDITHGTNFLKVYGATDIIWGNHEDRLTRLAQHHNEIVSRAASSVIREIREASEKLKAQTVEAYDIDAHIPLGDARMMHGIWYNENAVRDHAEHYGKVIIAHLHIVSEVPARRSDHARGYCVGTLANIPSMGYAKARRATARWSHGFAYGEYSDTECHVWLSQGLINQPGGWRLPL